MPQNDVGILLSTRQNIWNNLNPNYIFQLSALIIIFAFIVILYFLYINRNNIELQSEIVRLVAVGIGSCTGGYIGAKSRD